MRGVMAALAATMLLGLAACSATDPAPSPLFDGRYVGVRQSDVMKACGVTSLQGTSSASVTRGQLSMLLFGPKTQLTGTVGENGVVRASGIWPNPTGGFPGETVLNGRIKDDELEGTATDFRCRTDVHLRKVISHRPSGRSHDSVRRIGK